MKNIYGRRTGTIEITAHAKARLIERVGDCGNDRTWERMAKNARYLGLKFYQLPKDFQNKYFHRVRNYTKSTVATYYNGYFFIFKGNNGHARTLITVFGDDEHSKKEAN